MRLKTRKFPRWLQAFNVLCALTAAAIAGFGIWHLLQRGRARELEGVLVGRGDQASVDTAALAVRLATAEGGTRLAQALDGASDAEALRILDAAIASCLPGGLTLGAELALRSGPVGTAAASEVANAVVIEPVPPAPELKERVLTWVKAIEGPDVTVILAARAIVQESPYRRNAAIERIRELHNYRGIPALLAALGTPEPERETRRLAERALESFVEEDSPVRADGTLEDCWRGWWSAHQGAVKTPYVLQDDAFKLAPRITRETGDRARDALRGLGMVKASVEIDKIGHVAVSGSDPLTRAMAAWTLGRSGSKDALEPLGLALKDREPRVRIAALRAIGRARILPLKPDVEKLLEDPDASVKRGAALALLGFLDRRGLREIDGLAFDAHVPAADRIEVLCDLDETEDGAAASSRWIAALRDPDERVREAARVALGKRVRPEEVVVGRPAWQKWWVERYGETGVSIPLGAGN